MQLDNDDYRWQTSIGRVRVLFGKNPNSWNAQRLDSITVNGDSVILYSWKDYASQDVIQGFWESSRWINRPVIVEVPVKANDCDAYELARAIFQSVRYINDPNKLVIERTYLSEGSWKAVVINELGERKDVAIGDVVTRDLGTVEEIDRKGIVIEEYDWNNAVWKKKTLEARNQEGR